MSADDNKREHVKTIFTGVPEGWVTIEDNWYLASCRPVRSFSADPDKRVEELQEWAKNQVDSLVLFVPDYEKAPAGPIGNDKDVDEE